MPERPETLVLADANMVAMYRIDALGTRDGFVVERPGLVMCGAPTNSAFTNMAIVTGPMTPAAIVAATDATFGTRGLPSTVWTREHADGALEGALRAEGWHEVIRIPGMVLREERARPVPAARGIVVAPVRDDAARVAYAELAGEAWSTYDIAPASTAAHFHSLEHLAGPSTSAFLAWEGPVAVAGAVLYCTDGVAGVGWVSTRSTARGRGLGASITWAVVHEGLRRGARFASLQASIMGEPVYRRMGFETVTSYGVYLRGDGHI